MNCLGCGNKNAWVTRMSVDGDVMAESCNACSDARGGPPDVFFRGAYVDEHMATEAYPGPKYITSRAEKKRWMEKCQLREAGDRIHGATSFDPISHRHAMESLRRKHHG